MQSSEHMQNQLLLCIFAAWVVFGAENVEIGSFYMLNLYKKVAPQLQEEHLSTLPSVQKQDCFPKASQLYLYNFIYKCI